MKHLVIQWSLFVLLSASLGPLKGAEKPAELPKPNFVPLGVYLSWELVDYWAQQAGIDHWADLTTRLDACAANHVNTLWVTNMKEEDMARLLAECEKRGLKLVASMTSLEAKIAWRWANDGSYYREVVPRLAELTKKSPAMAGWVLSDEPLEKDLPNVEKLRQLFLQEDPQHFCLAVTMWPQTPLIAQMTQLPVVCPDLYPFYGPNDVNGPHTDQASRNFFRTNIRRMVNSIKDRDVTAWVMPQAFIEITGPFQCSENDDYIALPGAYYHWRMPTAEEIRWQIWETFRGQAKGVVFFQLAPILGCSPESEKAAPPDVSWKDILLQEPVHAGPGALLTRKGQTTPQMQEMGRIYGKLRPHLDLIFRWQATDLLLVEAENPGKTQSFIDPQDHSLYAIVINDDLKQAHELELRFEVQTTAAKILLESGPELSLKEDFTGGSKTAKVLLQAGEGTLIAITRSN